MGFLKIECRVFVGDIWGSYKGQDLGDGCRIGIRVRHVCIWRGGLEGNTWSETGLESRFEEIAGGFSKRDRGELGGCKRGVKKGCRRVDRRMYKERGVWGICWRVIREMYRGNGSGSGGKEEHKEKSVHRHILCPVHFPLFFFWIFLQDFL